MEPNDAEEQTSNRRWQPTGTTFFAVAAVFAFAVAIAAFAIGRSSGGGESKKATPAPMTAAVKLSDYKIGPASLRVAEGGTLDMTNDGSVAHNLAIDGQTLVSESVDPGKTGKFPLSGLAAGSYTVYCAIPGHRDLGMQAKLEVEAGSGDMAGMDMSGNAAGPTTTMDAAAMDKAMETSTKAFPAKTEGLGGQPLEPEVLADGTKQFTLTAKAVKWEVSPGKFVDAMTYNGTVPGPTIKVNPKDKVSIVVHNELANSTVVHWHGLEVPFEMDGVPYITQDPIKPGESFTYTFTAPPEPAVAMYHSHYDAQRQVADGMLGPLLVGEEPLPSGVTVAQETSMVLNDTGTIGLTLNGKSFPATAPVSAKLGDWVEVHYMNEGSMAHPMHLHGLPQTVIAKDGWPVPQPYKADTILVGPGERYTVLIHADQAGIWAWHCHILTHAENDQGMFGMVTAMIVK